MFVVSSFTFPSVESLLWKPWIQYRNYRKLPCCSLLDWLKIPPSHCSWFKGHSDLFFFACMLNQKQYLTVLFIQFKNIVPNNGKFSKNKQTTLKSPLPKWYKKGEKRTANNLPALSVLTWHGMIGNTVNLIRKSYTH